MRVPRPLISLISLPILSALAVAVVLFTSIARADQAVSTDAQHLSDSAFAMLNSITSDSSNSGASDVSGAIASFAGDAQTLSSALAKNDRDGASQAMAALISDRREMDQALEKSPKAIDASKWNEMKIELASLEKRLPEARGSSSTAEVHPAITKPPKTEVDATTADVAGPTVEITSRVSSDEGLHVKGYLQGTYLKSAGIYDGETLVKAIDLAPTTGAQRVLLDFKMEQVSPAETIRVADANGRTAEARIATNATSVIESGGHEKMIELGGGGEGTSAAEAPPIVVASRPVNTAEIPSKSPSRRHMHEGATLSPLTGVQINILGVQQSIADSNSYGVTGQIAGEGVKRAGIYIDGKLAKSIPVTSGGDTSFNVSFTMFGSEATIRAYGNGSNFVESALDLSNANGAIYSSNPPATVYAYPVNPYARSPYGYPMNPYGNASPYGPSPYGASPYGYPNNGYPNNGYPNGYRNGYGYGNGAPRKPWWQKIF